MYDGVPGTVHGATESRDSSPDYTIHFQSGERIQGVLGRADDLVYRYFHWP
jgi:hypothetical protein